MEYLSQGFRKLSGEIEWFHLSMKKVIKLQYYYLPLELNKELTRFVEQHNDERYHESMNNLRSLEGYERRDGRILEQWDLIKQKTVQIRCEQRLRKEGCLP